MQEVRQVFCKWLQQTVRLVQGSSTVEVEYQVSALRVHGGWIHSCAWMWPYE